MNIKRTQIRFIQIFLDSIASIVISLFLLFFFSSVTFQLVFVYAVVFLLIKISGNYFFGGYQQLWRYTSLREVQNLGFNSLLFIGVSSFLIYTNLISISLKIIVLDGLCFFVGVSFLRALRRFHVQFLLKNKRPEEQELIRTLLIGAGEAANYLLKDIKKQKNIHVVGVLDDDKSKVGAEIHRVRVIDTTEHLQRYIRSLNIQRVVIAIPSASKELIKNLVNQTRQAGVSVKVLPSLQGYATSGIEANVHSFALDLQDFSDIKEMKKNYIENLKEKKQKHVLVTGGAGYIGSHLLHILLENGYKVRLLDNFIYGREGIKDIEGHENLEIIEGDITNIRDVVRCIKDVDTVYALAAIVGDPACGLNAEETLNLNYESTKILIEAANFYNVRRFVFASSCSVYGATEEDVVTEDSALNPVSLYAKTRIMSEEVILERCGNVEPVIFRLSTVFGLSTRMRFDLVVNLLSAKGLVDGTFQVFGGQQWRPFIHCKDVARAFYLGGTSDFNAVKPVVFNLGGNNMNYTIGKVAEIIGNKLGQKVNIDLKEDAQDPRTYQVSFDRIEKVLGFKPAIDLESGVEEMISEIKKSDELKQYNNDEYSNVRILSKVFDSLAEN